MTAILLRRATIVDGDDRVGGPVQRDVRLHAGVIADVGDEVAVEPEDEVVDLDGWVLLPAAVEPHAHLDKALLAERVENSTGDLQGAIDAMAAVAESIDVADIVHRAERAARLMVSNGYVAVRSHADVNHWSGLRNTEALIEVRRRLRHVIDIEVVALAGSPVLGVDGAEHRAMLHTALEIGADLVGGCPHLEPDGRIEAATSYLLETAADAGVGVDLHTDETLDADVRGLEHLAHEVRAGFGFRVTASHCVSLGMRPAAEQQRVAEMVGEAGIGVVALPHTNLWLQGRDHAPMPRGLTAITALRRAGVHVAAGADNLQDPFNPLGRACPFETAALMVLAAHDLPAQAWSAVSTEGRSVLGLPAAPIAPGAPADLIAVHAPSLRAALAAGSPPRRFWRHGREQPTAG